MAKKVSRFQKIRAVIQGLLDDSLIGAEGEASRVHKFLHFWVLVGKSFLRNRGPLRASALSFSTLLALIPMLAVAMSVTSSLLKQEGEQQIYQFIDKFVTGVMPPSTEVGTNTPAGSAASLTNSPSGATPSHPPARVASTNQTGRAKAGLAANAHGSTNAAALAASGSNPPNAPPASADDRRVIAAQRIAANRIHQFIQNTQSGAIAGVGMLFLVYMALQMISQIEDTFNEIWGVPRGRNWLTRIVLYWAAITLGPLLLVGALGLASGSHLSEAQEFIRHAPIVGGLIFKCLPIFVLCLAFALVYWLMPNTRVHFSAALAGGIVGGGLWQLNSYFGFLYVSRVVMNSKIYGSLGLVPVFMLGTYFSWIILLLGAQVSYAFQNRRLYLQEKLADNVNQRGREFIALRLVTCIGQRFQRGLPPASIPEMSGELDIPSRLVQQVLRTLVAAHLVVELSEAEPAYLPARPLDRINAHHILMAMRATQGQEVYTRNEPVREEVYGEFARIQEAEKQVASSVTVLELVRRAQARLKLPPPPADAAHVDKLKPAQVPPATRSVSESAPEPNQPAAGPAVPEQPEGEPESAPAESKPAAAPPADQPPKPAASEPTPEEDRDFPL